MQFPIALDRSAIEPLHQQIFDQIRDHILDSRLSAGMRVPGSRELATALDVSRNTVLVAYDRLIAEGYLEARPAKGTFVNGELPDSYISAAKMYGSRNPDAQRLADRSRIAFRSHYSVVERRSEPMAVADFWVGRTDPALFPRRVWRKLLLRNYDRAVTRFAEYAAPGGLTELRQALAAQIAATRGVRISADQIVVVSGIQQALNLVARVAVTLGTKVAVEKPCYDGASSVFESYGASLVPIAVDEQGLDVDQLPTSDISLAFVTPSHQFPLGHTMSLERRIKLLNWAWDVGAYVVEDDYDSDFRHSGAPLTALKGLDQRGSVIYLGTFSKSIGGGLRLGFLALPRELVRPVLTAKALLDRACSWLEQAALAEFIAEGYFDKHVRRIRRIYRDRQICLVDALNAAFPGIRLTGAEAGMHVACHLPHDVPDADEIQRRAREVGVGVYALPNAGADAFGDEYLGKRVLVLGYASVTEDKIAHAVARLRQVV